MHWVPKGFRTLHTGKIDWLIDDTLMIKSFCVFYPHNIRCQFNMFCHWLYTDTPQFKWRDWNHKGFIYPYGHQNYKYQFTQGNQHDTQMEYMCILLHLFEQFSVVWWVINASLPRYGAFDLGLAVSVPLPIVTGIFVLLWFQSRLT